MRCLFVCLIIASFKAGSVASLHGQLNTGTGPCISYSHYAINLIYCIILIDTFWQIPYITLYEKKYSETPICRHPSQQDSPLIRTVESVTKALISVKMNPSNKDTP